MYGYIYIRERLLHAAIEGDASFIDITDMHLNTLIFYPYSKCLLDAVIRESLRRRISVVTRHPLLLL